MKPQKKQAIHDRIHWRVKATQLFYWLYYLRYRPGGNAVLTIAVSFLFMISYLFAPREGNSIQRLRESLYHRHSAPVATSVYQDCQDQYSNTIQARRKGCPIKTEDVDTTLKVLYIFLLFTLASRYWFILTKAQRNLFLGQEDRHFKLKYWGWTLGVLVLYWGAFRLDPIIGVIVVLMGYGEVRKKLPKEQPHFLEGRESMPYAQAKGFYQLFLTPEMTSYPFGGVEISAFDATRSFLFLGRAGSGKSVSMAMLLQKVIPAITSGSGMRAIINDHNQSMLPEITGMGINCPVYILNPLDSRGYAWDIAADFREPDQLLQLASIFVSKPGGKDNDFFNSAVRICFFAITYLFSQTSGTNWRLRDIPIALFSRDYLLALLGNSSDPNVRKAIEVLGGSKDGKIGSEKQAAGVMGTTMTLLDKFSTIAALSDHHIRAGRKFSLHRWSQESCIALLGNSITSSEAMGVFNRAFIHRSCEVILEMKESRTACNWLVMDEFVGLDKQDKIPKLALEGRKRGVCMVLGIQSVADVYALYGQQKGESLLGQIEHKAVLSVSDKISATWASEVIGSQTTWDGKNQNSMRTKAVVPASELIDLPVINPRLEIGLKGFYSSKVVHHHTYPFSFIKKTLLPPDESIPKFIPAPAQYKHLKDWDEDDIARLGIGDLLEGKSPEQPVDYDKIHDFFNFTD
jgi:hypothetical protein